MSDIIDIVKDKLCFVPKEPIISYALEKGLIDKKSVTKDIVQKAIINAIDEDMANDLVSHFSETIGFISSEIEKRLNITSVERKKWTKKGLLKVSGSYQTRAYGTYLDCPIYDLYQIINLSQETINEWRAAIKPLTEKQKAGLEKARETAIRNKTCIICGYEENHKSDLKNGWCYRCINRKSAYTRRKYWIENKKDYVVLDTESTGLGYSDQIIEISIIDLDGNVLLNTLILPSVEIDEEAYYVHGISKKYLRDNNAPAWDMIYHQVRDILDNKTFIAYNAEFDERMLNQTCRAFGLDIINTQRECLMHNVMLEWNSERYIKLADVVDTTQEHRALGDCQLCLEIINDNDIPQEAHND